MDVACLLLQIAVFGTGYWVASQERTANALAPLRDYLLQFYPSNHVVTFVKSAAQQDEQSNLFPMRLGDIGYIGQQEVLDTTLFIPRLRKPVTDPTFLARMYKSTL